MTEGQPNKPTPPIPPKPPAPTPAKKALVIRTMRDDLTQARRGAVPHSPAVTLMRDQGLPSQRKDPQSKGDTGTPPPIESKSPLQPSLPVATQEPEEFEAVVPTKPRNGLLITLIIIFLTLAIGAGGLWVWLYINDQVETVVVPDEDIMLTLAEVIPSNTLLVGYYNAANASQVSNIQQAWSARSTAELTMVEAIAGDPRLLLSRGISEFLYILLPGDPRFYLVIEGSDDVDQFLAGYSNIQVARVGQWRVVHSFNTSLYEQALTQGLMVQSGQSLPTGEDSFVITVSRQLLGQAHTYGDMFVPQNDYINLGVSFSSTGTGSVATLSTPIGSLVPPPVAVDATDILQRVPGDAKFIKIGSSFADQNHRATTPTTTQLFADFTDPYAYYERIGEDGVRDVGLVFRIPETLQGTFAAPDVAVEEALGGLIVAANLGERPSAGLTFADVTYQEVPLRYVNISTNQLALDYAVEGDFLMAATSREGMETAITVAQQGLPDALETPAWANINNVTNQQSNNRVFGVITQPALKRLFPGGNGATELPFGIAFDPTAITQAVAGAVALP